MKYLKKIEFLCVFVISVIFSFLSNITYILLTLQTPHGMINLGVTHHWEDYMYYISEFKQGAIGYWFTHNLYTEEYSRPTLVHWSNVLLGKIGGVIHLLPTDMYNISVIIFSFIFLLLGYYYLKKFFPIPNYAFSAFLFFLFSEPLMNKLPITEPVQFYPYELWNTPHYMFHRIGVLPHYLIVNIMWLFIVMSSFSIHKQNKIIRTLTIICMFFVTIFQPVIATLLLGIYTIAMVGKKKEKYWKQIISLAIGYIPGITYMGWLYLIDPYVTGMTGEAQFQVRTTIPFLLKSIGPIVPFALFGVIARFKKMVPLERFGSILLLSTYTIFLLPISEHLAFSNTRMLFAGQYIFLGWFAAVGLYESASLITRFVVIKRTIINGMLFFVFFISVTPTIVWEIQQKIAKIPSPQDPINYLAKTTFSAFQFLDIALPRDAIVLGNPSSSMDIRLPVFSGHKTVTGPRYATLNYEEKRKVSMAFYNQTLDEKTAQQWIYAHHINYVVYTISDGNSAEFNQRYSFLNPIFKTTTAVVFAIR